MTRRLQGGDRVGKVQEGGDQDCQRQEQDEEGSAEDFAQETAGPPAIVGLPVPFISSGHSVPA
ncbi:hypothetical protein D3C78_1982820 [compost metagenome]